MLRLQSSLPHWLEFKQISKEEYELTEKINAGVSVAFGRNLDLSGTSEVDVLLNFETGKHMEIEAGYRWFTYDYLSEENDSGVEIDLNGPFIAVNFPL